MKNAPPEANQALREQILKINKDDQFRALIESAPYALVIANDKGMIVYLNAQLEKSFGYTRADLLSKPVTTLMPERYHASYTTNQQVGSAGAELELYALRKDGSEFPVEVMLNTVETEDGILRVCAIRDISKQVKIIESLAEERRLLHVLMDNIPDFIYFKDTTSRFTRTNRAHAVMLGVDDPSEVVGKSDADFHAPELTKSFMEEEANIVKSGLPVVNREEFNPAPDGTARWFSATKVPIRDAYGRITGIVGVTREITKQKQTEEALRNSEEQFHSTFKYAAIGMALVSLDGHWMQVNPALCEIVGYTEQELVNKTYQDITHPDDLDNDIKFVSQLLAGEIQSYQMEKRYIHKLGHEVWVLLSVSLVRNSESQPFHFVSQIQNITERKRTEQALKAKIDQEREFQDYLKALHEITLELTKIDNLDEFYKRAVELGLQNLGFDRFGILLYDPLQSEVRGTYGTDTQRNVLPEHHIRLAPSNLTGILLRAYEKDERFVVDEETPLFYNLQPIGVGWNAVAVLWNGIEKLGWLAIDNGTKHMPMTKPVLDILGLYALTLGTLLTQKRTQIALKESERHLRLIAENSPDAIYILDVSDQKIVYLNRDTFLGYSQDELQKQTALLQIVHPDDKEFLFAHWRDIVLDAKRNNTSMVEYRLKDKTGQWQWIQSRETIFATSPEARPTQLLITLTIVTEHKQAEQQALELRKEREQVKILSDFIRDISHDFRTPLATINSSLYLLTRTTDADKQKGYLASAEEQIVRLTQLIDRLLIMGRLDSQITLNFERIDINQLILDITGKINFNAKRKGISVLSSLSENKLIVRAEADLLGLAFTELGKNAVQFTPTNGTISIHTQQDNDQVVIEVSDSGTGIADTELPLIFQRLYRVDKARSTAGGIGLGLSIAKRIIELHRGTILVESTVGQGSTFRVILPLNLLSNMG